MQCERVLRDAVARFKKMETVFGYVVIPPIAFSTWSLDGPHGLWALAALTMALAVAVIGRILQRQWCFGELVAELERVGPLDMAARRRGLVLLALIAIGYCFFAIWRILQAFPSGLF